MRLELLTEVVTTSGIAIPPTQAFLQPKKKKKKKENIDEGYMGVAKQSQPKNDKTLVWQPLKSQKKKRWYQSYAATNNPDERLLKDYRGHGY